MSEVRVHYNSPRPAEYQALAFTQGTDIHVAPGQERHLPHEAWHVVQQAEGRVAATVQMKGGVSVNDDVSLEQEADVMGSRAMQLQLPAEVGIALEPEPLTGGGYELPVQRMNLSRLPVLAPGAPIQLMRTPQERQALSVPFLQNHLRLNVGYLTAEAHLRNAQREVIGEPVPNGCMIVFDGAIRDNFSTGLSSVEKDHVYGVVVSAADRVPITAPDGWRQGWISYEKVDPDQSRSAALRLECQGEHANPQAGVAAYLGGLGGQAANPTERTRAEKAPAAIKAWAERTGTNLATPVPMDQPALHGIDFGAALAQDVNREEYHTVDRNNQLGLQRLNPQHQTFAAFSAFLNANAAAMPGTMAKDHELRDEAIGGARAAAGRAWLAQAGIDDTKPGLLERDRRPEIVAITGANVTNIFVNANAPTWAAYTANVDALRQQVAAAPAQQDQAQGHIIPAPQPAFEPWETLRDNQHVAAFVAQFSHPRPGEVYLFHGTSHANVVNISKTGFNPEFVNYTALKGYGKTGYGTAFTDQFAKALAYAPPVLVGDAPNQVYKHYVVVARVFIGNVYDVGDEARRTRGNLELTESNINYDEARGNKMKAQGQGMPLLGKASETVRGRLDAGEHLHSTYQHREFNLRLDARDQLPEQQLQYRDTSITVSDAIQMYPMFIIEAIIPREHVRTGRR